MQAFRKSVALLATCQALLFANNATLISVNALAGYALTETKSLATLPVTFWVCGAAAATLPASLLMRRLGRRGGFYLGSVLGVLAALLCAWAVVEGSFWGLCVGTFVFGMQNGIGHYYRFAAADISPPDYKATAISMVLAGGVFGGLVGPEVSTLTVDLLPARFAGTYLSLLVYILPTMLVLSWLRLPPAEETAQQGVARPMRVIARQPGFIVAVLCGAGAFAAMNLLMVSAALAMGFCGHPYSAAATVIGWHIFAMFAPSFFTGFLVRRLGLLQLMLVGVLLLYACVAVALSGQTVTHFWLALVLLGVAWNFLYIGGTTLLTESYQPSERAKTQGVNEIIVFVTQAVTSVASGLLVNSRGWDTVNYLTLPVITLIGAALLWLMLQRRAAVRQAPAAVPDHTTPVLRQLDPQALPVLAAAAQRPSLHTLPVAEARASYLASRRAMQPAPPEVAAIRDFRIDGPGGPLALRLYRGLGTPARQSLPVVLYFHGGGWVYGDLDSHDVPCRQLANFGRMAVLAVDYRLAPEHPFPAAIEDAQAALRWLAAQAVTLNLLPDCIMLAGDSAGGNIAAVLALAARAGNAEGLPPVAMQVLVYPSADLRIDSDRQHASRQQFGTGYLLERVAQDWARGSYVPAGVDRADWRVSPLAAKDVSGVARAFVITAGFDPLRDEGAAYARRLAEAGVAVTHECFEGQIHGFITMGGVMAAGTHALYRMAQSMRQAFPQAFGVKRPDLRV